MCAWNIVKQTKDQNHTITSASLLPSKRLRELNLMGKPFHWTADILGSKPNMKFILQLAWGILFELNLFCLFLYKEDHLFKATPSHSHPKANQASHLKQDMTKRGWVARGGRQRQLKVVLVTGCFISGKGVRKFSKTLKYLAETSHLYSTALDLSFSLPENWHEDSEIHLKQRRLYSIFSDTETETQEGHMTL